MSGDPSNRSVVDRAFDDAKRAGCNVLVVGNVTGSGLDGVHQLLMGADELSRRRVAVRPGGPTAVSLDESWTTVDLDTASRSAAADGVVDADGADADGADADGADANEGDADGPGPELRRARSRIVDELAGREAALPDRDRFDPGELRVSVLSFSTLVADHPAEEYRQFVRTVTAVVRGHRGMGHWYLNASPEANAVDGLRPFFEFLLEIDYAADRIVGRWHVLEEGVTTPWVELRGGRSD